MEEEKKVVTSKFDRLMVGFVVIGVIAILAVVIILVLGIVLSDGEGPSAGFIGAMFAVLGVFIVVTLIYAALSDRAKKEMTQQFLYWKGDEVLVKVPMDVETFAGRRRIKTPVCFAEEGISWENQRVSWDKLQGNVGYVGRDAAGQPIWYIRLYSAEIDTVLYFWCHAKNYGLIRRFCKSYIEGMPSVDEACRKLVDPARPLPPLPQKPTTPQTPSDKEHGTGGNDFGMRA